MTNTKYLIINNNQRVAVNEIPVHPYSKFYECNLDLLKDRPARHCVNYFGYRESGKTKLISCIADDETHRVYVFSSMVDKGDKLESLTARNSNFEKFECELHENFGLQFAGHPWLKPVRYPHNQFDQSSRIENYPFYKIEGEELHEVGVGPIHAGIIEPGHFRFICNGEQVMHLEIQLGYQHRGIEDLFIQKKSVFELATLAENIAGDTVAGHTTAFANLWESLCGFETGYSLHFSRTLALELERIAIHTGDLAAVCGDIAYQLGNSVYGRLRTPIVNFLQEWGGNRLAKGLVRVGKINYPFTPHLAHRLLEIFEAYERDFEEITDKLFHLPSALSRMEKTGVLPYSTAAAIGVVGMAARASGLCRDIRLSHPYSLYGTVTHIPVVKHHGDVFSRVQMRKEEIKQSIAFVKMLISNIPEFVNQGRVQLLPEKNSFVLSMVEGWRGEICHCAITGQDENLFLYKIKDPSFHNWMALAQAVRNNDISDFPLCNKSFNLSYAGHDL